MIKWQAQKGDECWITALSMISNISVSELHKKFLDLQLTGPRYDYNYLRNNKSVQWYPLINKLLLSIIPGIESFYAGPFKWTFTLPGSSNMTHQRRLTGALLTGKGILSVYLKTSAHAVAFENSMISDSNCHNCEYAGLAIPFKQWKKHKYTHNGKRVIGWRIDRFKEKEVICKS